VTNTDTKPFEFKNLFHNYFKVPDCRQVKILGLEQTTYFDKTKGKSVNQEGPIHGIDHEFDFVYQEGKYNELKIVLPDSSAISISKQNLHDTVVWNPWLDGAKELGDMGDDEFYKMVCVEAGNVASFIQLDEGKSFSASQVLRVSN